MNEAETVHKKILPYVQRRQYKIEDLDFETKVRFPDRYALGYADIVVKAGFPSPPFLIEGKRSGRVLNEKDRDQALAYGKKLGCFFVVVTNGTDIRCYNVNTGKPMTWNGKPLEKIPTKAQLGQIVRDFKADRDLTNFTIRTDNSLPYRPGLPLKQLNALFARCHNAIRKMEKSEDDAFPLFSVVLFLKLLEEKADAAWTVAAAQGSTPEFELPYDYRFYELAGDSADRVLDLVNGILKRLHKEDSHTYAGILPQELTVRNPETVKYILTTLSKVSLQDSGTDVKGAAFEYFVRATLRGKKLGQYFTPRQLIAVMSATVGADKIIEALRQGDKIKVLDPACGTGGFLVYLLQDSLHQASELHKRRKMQVKQYDRLVEQLKNEVFFGSDANPGVARAARMNLLVSADGHNNIVEEDSLPVSAKNWSFDNPDVDLILTNPPFGTSEAQSLPSKDKARYPVSTTKGQLLFVQKMVLSAVPGSGEVCTVIDEGMLNAASAAKVRLWLFQTCRVRAVVRLPDEAFKPNKINVRASYIYLERRAHDDDDLEDDYDVTLCEIDSLGYRGDGELIRGFEFERQLEDIADRMLDTSTPERSGYHWRAWNVRAQDILSDSTCRLDIKYWEPSTRARIQALVDAGAPTLGDINLAEHPIRRGISPDESAYVDERDGYALVIKAGSNVSKFGEIVIPDGADYVEQNVYEELSGAHVRDGDVLLSSTGDGTIGKCAVYRGDKPALADGHVTIIRPHTLHIWPEYLADYIRAGFGQEQAYRLFTGSTGLVELTPDHARNIVVDLLGSVEEQKQASDNLRRAEGEYRQAAGEANAFLENARMQFMALGTAGGLTKDRHDVTAETAEMVEEGITA
jgi:type I restriction enzyme M protein